MEEKMVLVTGSSGFVGTALCKLFARDNLRFRSATRTNTTKSELLKNVIVVGDIHGKTDWSAALQGVETVIHLAARVHVMQDQALDPLAAFRIVNVEGTLNLARQAAAKEVKRFIFLSSIKVNGEKTGETPFRSLDTPDPVDPYAVSKLEAENGLLEIAEATGLEVIILRPPLVYGREAGGNFDRLRRLAVKGWPLPLAMLQNRRSLIGIDNLCDCIQVCLTHPQVVGGALLVSDNQDISTPDLVRLLAASAGRSIQLLPVPVTVLRLLAGLCGRGPEMQRLTENLQVDCSETMRLLNWTPPVSLEEGIRRSIQ